MNGSRLHLRFNKDIVTRKEGVRIGRSIIPHHLIEEVDEKERSVRLYRDWKLYEKGGEFVISYHQLSIRIDASDIECIQTRPFF